MKRHKLCKRHKLPRTRKCYRCKEKICKECTVHRFHHYFCSNKCAYLWWFEKSPEVQKFKKEPLKTPIGKTVLYLSIFFLIGITIISLYSVKEPVLIKVPYILKQFKPSYEYPTEIKRITTNEKVVFLTFDGGSYNNSADSIIEILKDRNIDATFFITGQFIQKYPETARKIAKYFEVGNHLYDHIHLTTWEFNNKHNNRKYVNQLFIISQLLLTEEVFKKITGKDMVPLWRAPYGEENSTIRAWANRLGYTHIRWTFDTKDWVYPHDPRFRNGEETLKDILSQKDLKGYIILMHLGSIRKNDDFTKFIRALIDSLQNRGYRFLSLSEGLKNSLQINY